MIEACNARYNTFDEEDIYRRQQCYSQALFVWSAVQLGGCDPYNAAQTTACVRVQCDGEPMARNTISANTPIVDAVSTACGSVPNIAEDWTNFVTALQQSIREASASVAALLTDLAGQIQSSSLQPSAQIQSLLETCRRPRRRMARDRYRREMRLLDYFTNMPLNATQVFGCGQGRVESDCRTANALVSIGILAR